MRFFTTIVFLFIIRTWNGTLTAVNQYMLTFLKKFLKRFKISTGKAFTRFQRLQKNDFQKMYPTVDSSQKIPANNYFQIIQDENKHGLCIFKHIVFVIASWTYTLFAAYGITSNILFPLNLKIEEQSIKTVQGKTRCGKKLRFSAFKMLISLSVHNEDKVNNFIPNIYNLYNA